MLPLLIAAYFGWRWYQCQNPQSAASLSQTANETLNAATQQVLSSSAPQNAPGAYQPQVLPPPVQPLMVMQ